ncbi:hypothetical protein NQ318_017233 [Aromia moschata]|uniref:Zinc finger PHD-type domain-containing protein n=1 Tax=Aromia moschata TaxID=1265417 RepID=A0AAV8YLD0_9CUCU|nr:hypothetical protein NQ318_017233 [Aromia moschata]
MGFYGCDSTPKSSYEEIRKVGCEIIAALYSSKKCTGSLNDLRYLQFKTSTSRLSFHLASLPPTEGAAAEHSYRTYLQLQAWFGHFLDPKKWGWKLDSNNLLPKFSSQPMISDDVIKKIACSFPGPSEVNGSNSTSNSDPTSLNEYLARYLKADDISFKIPFSEYTVTLDKENLENGDLDFKLDFSSKNEVQARKKSKIKKAFVPILVLILLKAIVLIPLALGVLGIKTWNAIQLSFISFVSSIVLAIWKLCSKINHDHQPTIIHSGWDAHHHDRSGNAQQVAYSECERMAGGSGVPGLPVNSSVCKRCKTKVVSGQKCKKCDNVFHMSCAKLFNVKFMEDRTCCDNDDTPLDDDNAFFDAMEDISGSEKKSIFALWRGRNMDLLLGEETIFLDQLSIVLDALFKPNFIVCDYYHALI